MTKPVKDEIFGSRRSLLKTRLDFRRYENVFFTTCLRRINSDPRSRYLVLRECRSPEALNDTGFTEVMPFFRECIRFGNIYLRGNEVHLRSLRQNTRQKFSTRHEAARFLLRVINCQKGPLTPSTARIVESEEVGELSRFLRQEMFGRMASTDIDFIFYHSHRERLTLVEEKLLLHPNGGSLGHGQYLSFREILTEAFAPERLPQIRFYLLFIHEAETDEGYLYDFFREQQQPERPPSFFDATRNERRVLIPFEEMEKISLREFLARYVL